MTIILVSLIGAVIFFLLVKYTLVSLKRNEEDTNVLEMRKRQSLTSLRENALKRKLEAIVEDRAKKTKKIEIEELCLQAGLTISYGEYRLLTYFTAIVLFTAVLAGLHNIYLSIVFIVIGLVLPGQIITAIRNLRVTMIDKQVGSFMRLLSERYSSSKNFAKAIQDCVEDFKGQEPMYSELKRTSVDMNLGVNVVESMRRLAKRTGSKYLARMTDYYEIASELGTSETRENLLKQALLQYEENRRMKSRLRNELSSPVREAYIMVAVVPGIAIYMSVATPDYRHFMLHTGLGQFGSAAILAVLLGVVWFINKQIGKPLD